MDLAVDLSKSSVISPHLAALCSEPQSEATSAVGVTRAFAREIDLSGWTKDGECLAAAIALPLVMLEITRQFAPDNSPSIMRPLRVVPLIIAALVSTRLPSLPPPRPSSLLVSRARRSLVRRSWLD